MGWKIGCVLSMLISLASLFFSLRHELLISFGQWRIAEHSAVKASDFQLVDPLTGLSRGSFQMARRFARFYAGDPGGGVSMLTGKDEPPQLTVWIADPADPKEHTAAATLSVDQPAPGELSLTMKGKDDGNRLVMGVTVNGPPYLEAYSQGVKTWSMPGSGDHVPWADGCGKRDATLQPLE